MVELRVHLLGVFRLSLNNRQIPNFASKKAKSLFAYLLLHRGTLVSREVLAEALWGDHGVADLRKAFRQELWCIRAAFRKGDSDPDHYVITDGDNIGFRDDAEYWLDIDEFKSVTDVATSLAPETMTEDQVQKLHKSVALYQGDFLSGLYDEWCQLDREIYRDHYINALERLSYYYQMHSQWAAAIEQCKRLLHTDPLLEHIHRDLMRCHYAKGDRPAALRHFETCKRLLRRQLAIEPMAETLKLHEQIRCEQLSQATQALLPPISMRSQRQKVWPTTSADIVFNLRAIQGDIRTAVQQISALIQDAQ